MRWLLIAAVVALGCPVAARATVLSTVDRCADLPHADHPLAKISNGRLHATIFLPDEKQGYYRGSRFDWGGVVGCISLNGHTFFGEWFSRYEPTLNDAITGPVEEFRSPVSEIGYEEAAPGGLFVKPGVGVLRRVDEKPYNFGVTYPIVDHGRWTVRTQKRSVVFRQELHSSIGISYIYEKVLALDVHGEMLSLSHHLRNTGSRPIDTAVYDHDFFMLDQKSTGAGMQVRFPFVPVPDKPLGPSVAIDGNKIRFTAPLTASSVGAYLTGYSDKVSDYDITVEDTVSKIGVQQTSDSPISRAYFWATPKTICPEAYIKIHVAPGETQRWTIRYRFFTE